MADKDVKYTCTIKVSNIEALRDALNFHDEPLTVEITSDTPIGDGSSSGGYTPKITVNDTDYELEAIIESGEYDDYVNTESLITYIKSDDVTIIISNAFRHCYNLTEIDFKNVIEVQDDAFYDCTSLTTIILPAVTSIGLNAFEECSALENIEFPLVTSVEAYAFCNCTSLTTIILPAVTSIGSNAFQGCTSLTTINLPAAARERLEPNLESYGIDTTKTTVNWV